MAMKFSVLPVSQRHIKCIASSTILSYSIQQDQITITSSSRLCRSVSTKDFRSFFQSFRLYTQKKARCAFSPFLQRSRRQSRTHLLPRLDLNAQWTMISPSSYCSAHIARCSFNFSTSGDRSLLRAQLNLRTPAIEVQGQRPE